MLVVTQSTYTLFSIISRLQTLNTKNLLMLAVLSTVMLTALTAIAMPQTQLAFADKSKCKDNDNNNCNDSRSDYVEQKLNCKIENESEHHSDKNDITPGDQTVNCQAIGAGNTLNLNNDENSVSDEPGDVVICHRAPGNPSQSQTLSLSPNAAASHLKNHPFDTLGSCPV